MLALNASELDDLYRFADSLAARLTSDRDLVSDLAQEGRIAAWQAWKDWDPARGVPFVAYTKPRIRWAELHTLRSAGRLVPPELAAELDQVIGVGATPEDLVAAAEIEQQRRSAAEAERVQVLERLPLLAQRDQEIVRARLDGIAFRRIAAEHGISFSRVKAIARRAFARLRSADEAEAEADLEETIEVRASLTIRRVREQRVTL